MKYYEYSGPVMEFGRCLCQKWEAETYAQSPRKALSNIKYQFKKKFGKIPSTKIELPGTLREIGE